MRPAVVSGDVVCEVSGETALGIVPQAAPAKQHRCGLAREIQAVDTPVRVIRLSSSDHGRQSRR
jgi:hypothetical protein